MRGNEWRTKKEEDGKEGQMGVDKRRQTKKSQEDRGSTPRDSKRIRFTLLVVMTHSTCIHYYIPIYVLVYLSIYTYISTYTR